ncbi:hypothetical protein BT69DRAFT_1275965 [Atractiella rhizophila]|nr:hypothetical protein BT69DRAFT_1275965 [Atractiella rhizophila]
MIYTWAICCLPCFPFFILYHAGKAVLKRSGSRSQQSLSSRKHLKHVSRTRQLLLRKLPLELVDEIRSYDPETHCPSFTASSSVLQRIQKDDHSQFAVLTLSVKSGGYPRPVRKINFFTEGTADYILSTKLVIKLWKVGKEEVCKFDLDGLWIQEKFFTSSQPIYTEEAAITRDFTKPGSSHRTFVWNADHPALQVLQKGDRLVVAIGSVGFSLESARVQMWCK